MMPSLTTYIYIVEEKWGEKGRKASAHQYDPDPYWYHYEWREVLRTEDEQEALNKWYESGSDKRIRKVLNPDSLKVVSI